MQPTRPAEAVRAAAIKAQSVMADSARPELAQAAVAQAAIAQAEAARAEATRAQAARAEATRAEATRAEAARAEAAQAKAAQAKAAQAAAAKAARAESSRAEDARARAAQARAAQAEAAQADAARAEAAQEDAAPAGAAKLPARAALRPADPAVPADAISNGRPAWPPASIPSADGARGRQASPRRPGTGRPPARAAAGRRSKRPERAARRWQLAGALVAIIVVLGVVVAVSTLRHDASGQRVVAGSAGSGHASAGAQLLTAERLARGQAVSWLASQVSRDVIVSCDPVVCAALAGRGYPPGSLLVLKPTSPDPGGSDVIVATAGLRSQFGARLTGTFAPEVLASFGSGAARIDIRVVAPDGAAAYRTALSADLAARKKVGAEVASNRDVVASATARQQLTGGQVDARLLSDLNYLSKYRTVDIVGFGAAAPGASAGLPLRSADLIETDPAARLSGSAYVHALTTLLQQQQPPFRPASISTVALASGEKVLRIEFTAPSPLGLLGRAGP